MPGKATSKWWKEERQGVFLDYNQNAKDRTVASAYSVRPLPDARVSTPLSWDEVPTCEPEAFTIATVPERFATTGDPGRRHRRRRRDRSTRCSSCRRSTSGKGEGDAPWPPNYAKQAGEPPRVQPSRKRRPDSEYETGRGEAGGPPPEVAAERAAAVAAGDRNAGLPTEWEGSRPTPTGRRKTNCAGHRDLARRDRRPKRSRASSAGRRAIPRRRRRSSRPMSSSTACAAARRSGTGSAST